MKLKFLNSFFVMVFGALSVMAADDSISGVWKVTGSVGGRQVDQTCTLTQTDKKLSGSCKAADATHDITGEVDDKKVTWQFDMDYSGTPLTIIFTGTLDDNSSGISGKINVQPVNIDGDFSAAKESAKTAN